MGAKKAADGGRPAALFSDLVRVETRLYNAVDDRLKADLGIGVGRYEILDCISTRDRCRVLDIADAIAMTIGAASKAVDRIHAAGLCTRTIDPADRRSSHLSLTPAGRRVLSRARRVVDDELRRRFDPVLSADEQQLLGAALAGMHRSLEQDPTTGGSGRRVR